VISSIKLLEKLEFEIGGFSQGYESILLKDNEIFYKEHQFIDLLEPTKTVTDNEIREFLKTCDEIKLWSWKKEYSNQEILDGTQWELKIKKGGKLRGRNISGSNSYPQPIDKFNRFVIAINKLAGCNIELVEDI
jgi:hypothetical protein